MGIVPGSFGGFKKMPRRDAWMVLNLLEILLGKPRATIKREFVRRKKSLLDYEAVCVYIREKIK